MRAVGLTGCSASMIRSVRHHADRLALDYNHFTGGRRWTDAQLCDAVACARSWGQVAHSLGLLGGSSESTLKGHAKRLGLDAAHLKPVPGASAQEWRWPAACLRNLGRAGSLLSAAWFALSGWDVAWPLEPCRYDLIVTKDGLVHRVQVKTTTVRVGETWTVWLSKSRKHRVTYDPDEIDYFFVIDGDFRYYLIPVAKVGGLHQIHLAAYSTYRLERLEATESSKAERPAL